MQTASVNQRVIKQEPLRKRKRKRKKKQKSVKHILLAVALLLIFVSVASVVAILRYVEYEEMRANVEGNNIYNNIYVNGINIGGMSQRDALETLNGAFVQDLNNREIMLVTHTHNYIFTYENLGVKYNFSPAVEEAHSFAREGSIRERNEQILALESTPHRINFEISETYNFDVIRDAIANLEDELLIQPLNAKITRASGSFEVIPEQAGIMLDVEQTARRVEDVIVNSGTPVVEAVMQQLNPEFFAQDMAAAQSLLGTYSSSFSAGENGRNQNLITAIDKINDIVIYPGEVFSTNIAFGAMTYENGYRNAPVIVGGRLQDGMGGGVCQVSTALYNALLFAELEIVERLNHSLKVGYADYGFDATLAGDYIDLKFRNNTRLPVTIEAYIRNGTRMTVNIYGEELRPSTRRLEFVNSLIETIQPQPELITEDDSILLDVRQVVTRPQNGYRYNLYKIVYDGNVEVERVRVNTSTYRAVRGEVLVGTATTPEYNNIPRPTYEPISQPIYQPAPQPVATPEPAPESTSATELAPEPTPESIPAQEPIVEAQPIVETQPIVEAQLPIIEAQPVDSEPIV